MRQTPRNEEETAMPDQVQAHTGSRVLKELPLRLHHNAYVCANQERTRHFYEDIVGLPLVATWIEESEFPEFPGRKVSFAHTFFGIGDGGALAFFERGRMVSGPPTMSASVSPALFVRQHNTLYHFTEVDLPIATALYTTLQEFDQHKRGLAIALRRFNQSYSRINPEDQIIDLTIALESCLLGDGNEELNYRLALRGAALLAKAKLWEPKDARDLLKALYIVRSAIVHSGQELSNLGREATKQLRDLKISPDKFPQRCEDIVRYIVRTYVLRLAEDGASDKTVRTICVELDQSILEGLAKSFE